METSNLNNLWAGLLVEELVRNGVKIFVIAPGSRSAPLAVEAFRNPKAETVVHFDERGAAFFALGSGRMDKPVAVICTSGTAVANCWPAVAEAYYSGLPLVILSADRPPELQACAANQTMDQARLFGSHVRAHLELPCPDLRMPPEAVLTKVDAVLAAGLGRERGPVHINCMFREPLIPTPQQNVRQGFHTDRLVNWETSGVPFTRWEETGMRFSSAQKYELMDRLCATNKGLFIIGRLHTSAEREAALELANKLQWPVFADITSGCRRFDRSRCVVRHYDLLLRSETFKTWFAPECVLHVGDVLVSKWLQQFLQHGSAYAMQISARSDNRDAAHRIDRRFITDIASACRQLADLIEPRSDRGFLEQCLAVDEVVRLKCEALISKQKELTELTIARVVDDVITPDMALFLGNSMPVRDMDSIATKCHAHTIHANRGLSGIDGNIATASGIASGTAAGVAVLLGDMAALHDLNSLALLPKSPSPVIVIIINNQGGGIFSFLPVAEHADVALPCFINPHSWTFEAAAAMFNLDYRRVTGKESLMEMLQQALQRDRSMVFEIAVDRNLNVSSHRLLCRELSCCIDAWFDGTQSSFDKD